VVSEMHMTNELCDRNLNWHPQNLKESWSIQEEGLARTMLGLANST